MNAIKRLFGSKSQSGSDPNSPPFLDKDGFVAFAPGDPEDPQNWTTWRKMTCTLTSILLVLNATLASSGPSSNIGSMTRHFHVSGEAAALTVTLFLLGYSAGPLLFAPLSEYYGRRPVFVVTFTLYFASTFLCVWAPSFGGLLVARLLTGTFVSSPLTNAPAVLVDIFNPLQRTTATAVFSAMVFCGPAIGPIISGFLEVTQGIKGWQWGFGWLLILAAATEALVLTIPETYAPQLLKERARRARAAGHDVKARSEVQTQSMTQAYKIALVRPWQILVDPISFLIAIYLAVVYMLLYMLFSIYPIVFQEKRGWNAGVGQLPLLGTTVGSICAGIIVGFETRRRQKKIDSGQMKMADLTPEDRLPMSMIAAVGFSVSMFWFAWTAQYNSVHWIVPTIAGGFLGCSMLLLFVSFVNYLIDVYLMFAASALAANTVLRSLAGAASPLFTHQMFTAMGVGGGGSLVGGVAALLAIIPFLFYKFGPAIRARSTFSPQKFMAAKAAAAKAATEQKDQQQPRDMEAGVRTNEEPERGRPTQGESIRDDSTLIKEKVLQ